MISLTGLHRKAMIFLLPVLFLVAVMALTGSGAHSSLIHEQGDLDGDGVPEEYSLKDHSLTVKEGETLLWESPSEYRIDSFALGDVDNDGADNLAVSLWKLGSFGDIKPFWHTGEDLSYKNHLFVYKLQENRYKPVWCSSDLGRPIRSFEIRDANGDSKLELVTMEGHYGKAGGPARTAVWQWQEWGFSQVLQTTE